MDKKSSPMRVDKVDKRVLGPVLMGFFIMGFCDIVAPISGRIATEFPASQQAAVSFLPTMVFLWFLVLSTPLAALMNRIGRKAMSMIGYAFTSSGVHSNGFSLVRKVFDVEHTNIQSPCEALGGASIGETLLTPTKIYVKPMLALFDQVRVKGVSHITGGGFYENIPRAIPDGLGAKIQKSAIRILPIFDLIAKTGHIPERDMFNTFNMGVGMSVVVAKEDAETALSVLQANGEDAYLIGEIVASQDKVILE